MRSLHPLRTAIFAAAFALSVTAFPGVALPTGGVLYASAQVSEAQLYDTNADARAELKSAILRAHEEHKRVLLDFGGNWCGDCKVLDINFHKPENLAVINQHFILLHIDIGRFDKNTDIAERFGIPLQKGVPALAVVDGKGNLVYAQKNGEFESMRRMDPASVNEFLVKWSAAK